MRVLWIAPNGGNYKSNTVKGTGGWIGALQDVLIKQVPDLKLGISFLHPTDGERVEDGNVTYLPVQYSKGRGIKKALSHLFDNNNDEKSIAYQLKMKIDEYKPDIVHIWGLESIRASVIPFINRPFVVHIQGLLSSCIYMYLPYGFSKNDLFKADFPIRWLLRSGSNRDYKQAKRRAEREIEMSKYVRNWIGRTEWDYTLSKMLNPKSRYFHGEEMMRADFSSQRWLYHYDGKTCHIHSSISGEWYKGIDIILKTAQLMKVLEYDFEWKVYGVIRSDYRLNYFINKLKIVPEQVGVKILGRVDGMTIREGLLSCDVYVHPSYIENSSNAIAEAMLLGVPTIAQYVGGNPSMLRDGSGVLVAPNEPYMMASKIMDMCKMEVAERYSDKALIIAKKRQDPNQIVENLMIIYQDILKSE